MNVKAESMWREYQISTTAQNAMFPCMNRYALSAMQSASV